jgi:hypothetical protein
MFARDLFFLLLVHICRPYANIVYPRYSIQVGPSIDKAHDVIVFPR